MFVRIDNPEKLGQIFFPLERMPFFSKKNCVSNNLLGPTELILYLRQQLSK